MSVSALLEQCGFGCTKKLATRQSEISSFRNGHYKVVCAESTASGDSWKLYHRNALLESGETADALSGKLDALFSDNAKKYMSFLESMHGYDKAVVESIETEFLVAILENESRYGSPQLITGNSATENALLNFRIKYKEKFNAKGYKFGIDTLQSKGVPRHTYLNILPAGSPNIDANIYSALLSPNGKKATIYKGAAPKSGESRQPTVLHTNVPIDGGVGSDKWNESLYGILNGAIDGTLGKPVPVPQEAERIPQGDNANPNSQPETQGEIKPTETELVTSPTAELATDGGQPAAQPQSALPAAKPSASIADANKALRNQFNEAIKDLYCEKENTRHPSKPELFLNVGVWLTKEDAASAKQRGRIDQYQGISSIDNKDGGPEIAVIFRGGKAFAFSRQGGLYEGGRWKEGRRSSTYTKMGEVPDAAAFRKMVMDILKVGPEDTSAGKTNAQAMKDTAAMATEQTLPTAGANNMVDNKVAEAPATSTNTPDANSQKYERIATDFNTFLSNSSVRAIYSWYDTAQQLKGKNIWILEGDRKGTVRDIAVIYALAGTKISSALVVPFTVIYNQQLNADTINALGFDPGEIKDANVAANGAISVTLMDEYLKNPKVNALVYNGGQVDIGPMIEGVDLDSTITIFQRAKQPALYKVFERLLNEGKLLRPSSKLDGRPYTLAKPDWSYEASDKNTSDPHSLGGWGWKKKS